jgi:hypothetical protein
MSKLNSGILVLVTMYKLDDGEAWTYGGQSRILMPAVSLNTYALPHEVGHVLGWTNPDPKAVDKVHTREDRQNLMYFEFSGSGDAGSSPDCQYCRKLALSELVKSEKSDVAK